MNLLQVSNNNLDYCSENNRLVLFQGDLLLKIIGNLENPKDVETARSVCKVWREKHKYTVNQLIVDIKGHDEKLWCQLKNLKKFIKDGAVHYTDKHTGIEEKINNIVIVQTYNKQGELARSWVAPFIATSRFGQCKNPFVDLNRDIEKVEKIFLTTIGQGIGLQAEHMHQLVTKRICYQKNSFSGRFERNLMISVKDLLKLIG